MTKAINFVGIHIEETTCEECPIGKGAWCKNCDSFPHTPEQVERDNKEE